MSTMRLITLALVALLVTGLSSVSFAADGSPVFHLDFSSFADVSGNSLEIDVGEAVSLVPGGGPTLAGGATLDSARWEGEEDETNQIIIFDHELLDAAAVGAGSIVTWIKTDDEDEWNNIAKTPCVDGVEPCDSFGEFAGIEFQASGPHAGVFGAVQGWNTNVFSPESPAPFGGGDGSSDTPTDEWTHAALTWNADGDHTIYVNGEPGETVLGVGDFDFGENLVDDWTIGGDGLGAAGANVDSTRYLSGELADFAIFDVELTAEDIVNIMSSGVGSSLTGDFNQNGVLDSPDIDDLTGQSALGTDPPAYDLDADSVVDDADVTVWIKDLFNSWVGDANLDGEFGSGDLVAVLASGTYEVDTDAVWSTGDFNGDGRANTTDLVTALADGGYEAGPRAGTAAVPEPASSALLCIAAGCCLALVRRRRR